MVSNGGLYTNIMEQLRFEPTIDEKDITVAIKGDGIVVLGGKVKSYPEKYLAEQAIEKIDKVKGIANEIEVDLNTDFRKDDTEIVKAAINALEWTLLVPHDKIKVAVHNGYLTLTGKVEYNYQKERAQKAVQDLYGVISVTNNIIVKPSVNPKEVKEKIIKEFERNARIDANNIIVEVDGSKVILKGRVHNLEEDREARNAAWSVAGVNTVIDELRVF